jgi:hypothetical protein
MDWVKIGSALFLVAMMVFIFPRMRQAIKHSPKGTGSQWTNFLVILLVVSAFVMFLISMV